MKTAFKSDSDRSSAAGLSSAARHGRTRVAVASLHAAFAFALLGTMMGTARADSVWPAAGRGMFADRKACATGDIITIVVAESVAAQNSQSTKSSRASSMEDAIQKFVFSGGLSHGGEMPGISLGGKSSSSGGGDISNSQSLSSRAAVLVTDVLPNGNLVIEGVRMVRSSGETQYVVLHGLVRADDVLRDNTVISSNIADARLEFYAEGALTDAQKRGWLAKAYEKLRPF
jgi:flagellar L-ring protein precursor FlgH